jgi:hypothetical protein
MTLVALTAFITVTDRDGNTPASLNPSKFQNGKHEGVGEYKYLSFLYQGAAMNRSGDNLEASLILANSPLSIAYAKQFVENKYYVKIETFLMTADFNKDTSAENGGKITGEYWLVAGMRYDPESVELVLSSAIDAVGANAPQQTLTMERCAHLPLTGQIQNL